mmetsp:Transcript_26429/g.55445  ORF Transcript_26429/g.55445 Transcript_26429/m.55445 type:complete len:583 (-) Transcript_26429:83-1831(-)
MSSGPSSVERVSVPAGDDHPLAAGAVTTTVTNAAQSQSNNYPQANSNSNAMPPPTVGAAAVAASSTQSAAATAATTTAATTINIPIRSHGIPGGDAGDISPSSKSLDALADDFLSSKPPPIVLRPNPLPRGEVGIIRLRTLVERRAWGDVLKLASSLLGNDGGNESIVSKSRSKSKSSKSEHYSKVYASLLFDDSCQHDGGAENNENDDLPLDIRLETIEIMMLQCNSWLKLRRYADLSKEVKRWKFLKQNDVNARSIEWLPWGIHILASQSLEYSDDTKQQTTDVLCHLREDIPTTECRWLASLDSALANIYIRRGEWRLAIGSLDRAIDLIPEATQAEVHSMLATNDNGSSTTTATTDAETKEKIATFLSKTYIAEILSRQGQIFVQAGGLSEAIEVFEKAEIMWTENESLSLSSIPLSEEFLNHNKVLRLVMPALVEINSGLIYFSKSNYDSAVQSFSNAMNILQTDGGTFCSKYHAREWVGPAVAGFQTPSLLYNEAVNNSSLCHLYTCNMQDAIVALQKLVREDPTAFLTERVAFNLCTLYELGSDPVVASRNKRVLQLIAKRFFLHDVGPESFRVT